jgi:PAS domain S-box-containing protein
MFSFLTPFTAIQIAAAIVSAAMAAIAWRKRNAPGGLPLALLLLAATEWGLADALEVISGPFSLKIFWAQLKIIGSASSGVCYLIFALEYDRRIKMLTRRNVLALWIVPIVSMAIAATNNWHHLFWSTTALDPLGGIAFTRGLWYWVNAYYTYGLRVIGTLVILWTIVRTLRPFHPQTLLLLTGALAPWISNVIYVFFPDAYIGIPLTAIELHPIFLSFSGLILGWGIFRYRLLDVIPIGRDAVLETIQEGLIVLDARNRIVDINPAAKKILQIEGDPLGEPITIGTHVHSDLANLLEQDQPASFELEIGSEIKRQIEFSVSVLRDQYEQPLGKSLALRDITERKRAQMEIQSQRDFAVIVMESMGEGLTVTDQDGRYEYVNLAFARMLGLPFEALIGKSPADFIVAEDHATLEEVQKNAAPERPAHTTSA